MDHDDSTEAILERVNIALDTGRCPFCGHPMRVKSDRSYVCDNCFYEFGMHF